MPSLSQQRHDAKTIFEAALEASDPALAISRHVRLERETLWAGQQPYDLSQHGKVYAIGAGKAAAKMALALEELLGKNLAGGLVIVKRGYTVRLRTLEIVEAGHPIPDQAGVDATKSIIELLTHAGEKDLVICLVSGGASTLLCCPADGLSLQDKQKTTQVLLSCGARIQEVNAIRKHISKVKGGRLAELARPATILCLIGDPIDHIGSGPTAPDSSSFSDCLSVTDRYGIATMIPEAVKKLFEKGAAGDIAETLKAGAPVFHKVQNLLVGNNRSALSAAKERAEALGYQSVMLSSAMEGEARKVAIDHAAMAKNLRLDRTGVRRPVCILSGGETTVTIQGGGLGGRNQEFALAAAIELDGVKGVVVLSGATDGTDGPTDAAGGIVDGTTVRRAREKGLDAREYLQRNDSHHLLKAVDDLLMTGPTLTNVMDVQLVLLS
jgi:hydroxypyruvate reductase